MSGVAPAVRLSAALLVVAGLWLAHAGVLSAAPPRGAGTSDEEVEEYRVKAASLVHFIHYTVWPKSAFEREDSPFVVLVIGEDPFGEALEQSFEGKKGAGRPIRVVRSANLEQLPRAHLIFLARSHHKEIAKLLAGPAGKASLVVGDTEGLAEDGAHVNFYLKAKRLGFEVNTEAVKRSDLTISPEMLKLARIVKDRKKEQDP